MDFYGHADKKNYCRYPILQQKQKQHSSYHEREITFLVVVYYQPDKKIIIIQENAPIN